MTSEEKLGFIEPPEHQCPVIDDAIKRIRDIEKSIGYALRSDSIEEAQSHCNDADWYGGDIECSLEYLRDACETLRFWGQQWKDIAKELIEEYEPERLEDE